MSDRSDLIGLGVPPAAADKIVTQQEAITTAFGAADTVVSSAYIAADSVVSAAYIAADSVVTLAFAAADTLQRDTMTVFAQSALGATAAAASTGDYDTIQIMSVSVPDNAGFRLRTPTDTKRRQVVINATANVLQVYPPTGGKVNAQAVDTAVTQASGIANVYYAYSTNAALYYWQA